MSLSHIPLSSGRSIELTELRMSSTYGGMLEGYPCKPINDMLQHPAVLTLLEQIGLPAQIRKAARRRLVTLLRPKTPGMGERLVEDTFEALDEQTVAVPGTEATALIVPSLAGSLAGVLDQQVLLARRIE